MWSVIKESIIGVIKGDARGLDYGSHDWNQCCSKDSCDKDAIVNHAVVLIGYGTSKSENKDKP